MPAACSCAHVMRVAPHAGSSAGTDGTDCDSSSSMALLLRAAQAVVYQNKYGLGRTVRGASSRWSKDQRAGVLEWEHTLAAGALEQILTFAEDSGRRGRQTERSCGSNYRLSSALAGTRRRWKGRRQRWPPGACFSLSWKRTFPAASPKIQQPVSASKGS